MKHILWFVFPLAFISFLVPVSVQAQTGMTQGPFQNVYIKIQVRNPDGSSASQGILIQLESAGAGVVDQCTTGSNGFCQFNPRTTGLYVLSVRQHGYLEIRKDVDLRDVRGAYVTLDLRSDSAGDSKDAKAGSVSAADLAVPDDARKEFDAGQKALEAKDLNSGVAHLQKAIQLYDAFPQAYTMLGGAYVALGKYKDAEAALQKAVQLDPKASGAFIELGAAFNQEKDYPAAEKALSQGLTLNPEAVAGHYEIAKTYMALGRWQDADPHATKALAALPDMAPVHVLMGNILLKKRDARGALHEFQEYLRLDPNGSMAPSARDIVAKIQAALGT
ncbi:MAG: tetratricopeptide repeat protein [Candidatus Acidiferrales bacterium]